MTASSLIDYREDVRSIPVVDDSREIIVRVEDISKSYGSTRAVNNVSTSVRRGEVFGVLGPNGAGKTTLLEIIEGLRKPDIGSVTIFDVDTRTAGMDVKSKIGVMTQEHWLPHLSTVGEIAALYEHLFPGAMTARDMLELVDLPHKRRTRISRLSAGQRQRLAFGLAIIGRPQLLFLDEPTTALDPQGRRFVWDLVRQAQEEWGCTIILTTHSMEEAETLCDRVEVIDAGAVIASGTPIDLVAEHCPGKRVRLRVFGGETLLRDAFGDALSIDRHGAAVIQTDRIEETLPRLQALGLTENIISVDPNGLEDVFFALTGKGLRD